FILDLSLSVYDYFFYFFFFQAEDGIRDKLVTGVQTCALPISTHSRRRRRKPVSAVSPFSRHGATGLRGRHHVLGQNGWSAGNQRSEERRVGKECRSWWWAYD